MNRPPHPYIVDVEASGFGSHGYPIEVGLALEPDQRYCTLIRPADDWVHWDDQAEAVHQVSRENLMSNGRLVTDVAIELNRLLRDKVVYSDAWSVDYPWIIKLYAAAGMSTAFKVSALEMILTERQLGLWSDTRDSVIADLGLQRHRASNDARIIQETYLRTLSMLA
jgi:hypothetical protein